MLIPWLRAVTPFTRHFRHHVGPRLLRLTQAEARCVWEHVSTFNEAYDALWRYAVNHGALHMPDDDLDDLIDWLLDELGHALEDLEASGAEPQFLRTLDRMLSVPEVAHG